MPDEDKSMSPELHDGDSLVARLAPELRGIYELSSTEFPALFASDACGGIALRARDPLLYDTLTASGRWRGVRHGIVVKADASRTEALEIRLHEFGHVLTFPAVTDESPPTTAERELADRVTADMIDNPGARSCDVPGWLPSHDQRFTRAAIHLSWRASQAGYSFCVDNVCAGLLYDLAPANIYMKLLEDECRRFRHSRFADILATPLPAAFVAQWESDFSFWKAICKIREARARREQEQLVSA